MADFKLDDEAAGVPPTPAVNFSPDQFRELIDAMKANRLTDAEANADVQARAIKRQLYPQNETFPQISPFNPRGDRDHPRPALKCPFFLGPYPLEAQTLTVTEITLMNQLLPGQYEVTKSDGQVVIFLVIPRYMVDGTTLDRLTIGFPCADSEQRQNFPPFGQMLREVVDQQEVRKLIAS